MEEVNCQELLNYHPQNESTRKEMLKAREQHARNQVKDYSHVFREKTRYEMMRLCSIMMGIEFVYSAETAFVSPILLSIGMKHQNMTMVWGLSPFLGFFLAPILGSLSDKCRLKLGRRRPLIMFLAIGLLAGLLFAPYGKDLGEFIGDTVTNPINITNSTSTFNPQPEESSHFYWAIIFTILGTIFLDFNADNIQAPSRAYLLDMCIQEEHTRALGSFSVMAGIGGFFGYGLGAIDWENTFLNEYIGNNVKTVFALVSIIFIVCLIFTLTSFREIPLKLLESDHKLRPLTFNNINDDDLNDNQIEAEKIEVETDQIETETDEIMSLSEYLKSIVLMPKSMKILCLTNYLCWICQLCYVLYFTDFVGEAVFHGDPSASYDSEDYKRYEEGVRFGCWGMSIYALACAIYAHFIETIIKRFNTKKFFVGGLILYGIVMAILAYWPTKWGVLVFSVATGIVYATAFSVPFMLVARYHGNGSFKEKKKESTEVQPPHGRGLGTDIAIVESMLFLAQISLALGLGWFIDFLGSTSAILYTAATFSFLAAISACFCVYMDEKK